MTLTADAASSTRATLAGYGAIALWASLAVLTVASGDVPPFQLTAMAFAVGSLVGVGYAWINGRSIGLLRKVPWRAWALGLYGLLGYHVCYFASLRRAPALEASLINYLWPLLIVVFAAVIPKSFGGRPLRWQHVLGGLFGFAGTVLILLQKGVRPGFEGAMAGYALAFAAALIWSSYSVASRLFRAVSSTAVTGFCAGTALGAALLHLWLETWVWPASSGQWLAILAMGLGPLGLAFYLWDEGMKHGDMLRLGLASYATPLLSTLVLAVTSHGTLSPVLAIAALMVSVGGWVAGRSQLDATNTNGPAPEGEAIS